MTWSDRPPRHDRCEDEAIKILPPALSLPQQTVSGPGAIARLLDECEAFGQRGLIVCGQSLESSGLLRKLLGGQCHGESIRVWKHPGGEPTLDQLGELLSAARTHRPDWVLGIGGGSVIDIAKAGAGLLEAPLPPVRYHDGEPIPASHIVFVAAPTTAGTGSEATTVSVLTNSTTGTKKSIRHPSFMARLVCLDPTLLESCPPHVIAWSGMDAFAQAVESFCSRHATWFTDQLTLKAATLVQRHLPRVHAGEGTDEDRQNLLLGSYLSGLALSNARLGLVHGLAHPLGARYHLAHGLVCGVCLPAVIAYNRDTLGDKYDVLADRLGGDPADCAALLLNRLGIESPFKQMELNDEDGIVAETLASGSTAANPRDV